jgi:hypothetical protein
LNRTAGFAKLSPHLIKECLLHCILDDFDPETFVIENHQDSCVTYSNYNTLIFLMVEYDAAVILEIQKAVEKITHLKTIVLTIEMDGVFITENQVNLRVLDIINSGIKLGISRNNLFLIFLKELFELPISK